MADKYRVVAPFSILKNSTKDDVYEKITFTGFDVSAIIYNIAFSNGNCEITDSNRIYKLSNVFEQLDNYNTKSDGVYTDDELKLTYISYFKENETAPYTKDKLIIAPIDLIINRDALKGIATYLNTRVATDRDNDTFTIETYVESLVQTMNYYDIIRLFKSLNLDSTSAHLKRRYQNTIPTNSGMDTGKSGVLYQLFYDQDDDSVLSTKRYTSLTNVGYTSDTYINQNLIADINYVEKIKYNNNTRYMCDFYNSNSGNNNPLKSFTNPQDFNTKIKAITIARTDLKDSYDEPYLLDFYVKTKRGTYIPFKKVEMSKKSIVENNVNKYITYVRYLFPEYLFKNKNERINMIDKICFMYGNTDSTIFKIISVFVDSNETYVTYSTTDVLNDYNTLCIGE